MVGRRSWARNHEEVPWHLKPAAGWDYRQHGCSLWSYTTRVSGLSQRFPEGSARDMVADVSASYMLVAAMSVVTVALGPLALSLGRWLGSRLRPHDKAKKVSTARASSLV